MKNTLMVMNSVDDAYFFLLNDHVRNVNEWMNQCTTSLAQWECKYTQDTHK